MRVVRPLAGACVGIIWLAGAALAQTGSVFVRVKVVDTLGVPVAGAAITVARGLEQLAPEGETDAAGSRTFRIEPTSGSYELIVRKIGYSRASSFFATKRDSVSIPITLRRAVQTLEAVKVSAQEDAKRKSYYIDADEIANSPRLLLDGLDILTKLKPDILSGRMPGCGVQNVFVNGKRIIYPVQNDMALARRGIKPSPKMVGQSGRPLPAPRLQSSPEEIAEIMAEIKPEHIAEMTYEDCFSTKVDGLHTSSALFVVLKPGVSFEDGRGTFIAEERARTPVRATAAAPTAAPTADAVGAVASGRPPVPAYRSRLLGVFDAVSGAPIDSVAVTDSLSGTTALTTQTGTVSLLFLPEGPSTLKIAKAGYAPLTLDVSISPADTMPITLVLTRPAGHPR